MACGYRNRQRFHKAIYSCLGHGEQHLVLECRSRQELPGPPDVLAKGALARHALAIVTVPESDPDRAEESLYQVLAGIRAALDPRGVTLVGGHSTQGEDLFVGLARRLVDAGAHAHVEA